MVREKICELGTILKNLESVLFALEYENKWLTVAEVAKILHMSTSTIQTFKDRIPFKPYIKKTDHGCRIKNCPEAMKLLQCYKYRNFEYERMVTKNEL